MDVDGSRLDFGMLRPAILYKIIAVANDRGRLEQATQQPKLQRRQCDIVSAPLHFHRRKVHFKVGKPKHRSGRAWMAGGKAQIAQTPQELQQSDRIEGTFEAQFTAGWGDSQPCLIA